MPLVSTEPQPEALFPTETSTKTTLSRVGQEISIKSALKQRFLVALTILAFTFVVCEGFARLMVVNAKPFQTSFLELDRKYQLAQTPVTSHKPVIYVLGDSLIDFAVYPEYLNTVLKDNGYDFETRNLATPGNTIDINLFLLKASLKAGTKPRFIIFNVNPRLFNRNYNLPRKEALFNKSYAGRCKLHPLSLMQQIGCQIEDYSYLARYRNFFKEELTKLPETLFETSQRAALKPVVYAQNEISPEGWAPAYEVFTNEAFNTQYTPASYLKRTKGDLSHFQWDDQSFKKLYRFCQKNNISLILVRLPEHPIREDNYRYYHLSSAELNQRYLSLSKSLGIPYIDAHHVITDSQSFRDPDHLNAIGAIAFTQSLANTLIQQGYLGNPSEKPSSAKANSSLNG